ncbi:MAG: Ig-like domain-containing protein [Pseudarcicella sp.]|nr:Ig-like domain-containing protein [Pseudarcicella sp.]
MKINLSKVLPSSFSYANYFKKNKKKLIYGAFSTLLLISSLSLGLKMNFAPPVQPKITSQTWAKGTFLSHIKMGARLLSYHRGYLYMHSLDNTSVWDVENPANPLLVDEVSGGDNGHRWWKWGDLFYREYTVPETKNSNSKFIDLENMTMRKPWTKPAPFPILKGNDAFQDLETFPITLDGNNINDMRTGQLISLGDFSAAPNQELKIRIGNLLLFAGSGAAAYDISDPKNTKLLDRLSGNFNQYTTTVHVWRNYLIYMNGDNSNEGGNNLVAIDFSDPTDLKYAFGMKLEDSPGRYMFFQDEYGFTGRGLNGVKVNLETRKVEHRFTPPGHPLQFSDFQWVPLGHILVASGAESGTGESFFFTHQEGLDRKAPYVSFNSPAKNAINQSISSNIGFVINETLDDITINDKTIQVTPLDGSNTPIEGYVISSSYNTINYTPKNPLKPNTTYEVKLVGGGIKDVAGNGIKETVYRFSTGSGVNPSTPPTISSFKHLPDSPILKNTAVSFSATATTVDGGALSYRWDFGDGTPKTAWSTSNATTYTYTSAGNYSAILQVKDASGNISTKINRLLVVDVLNQSKPTQSSQIVVDAARRKVWNINADNNSVSIINADNHLLIKEINVGQHPSSIAIDGKNQVWVTCREDNKLVVLNATTGELIQNIAMPYGSQPSQVVFSPDGNTGFVSEYASGKISKINATTRVVSSSTFVVQTIGALAVSGDGNTLLATRYISPDNAGEVYKLNTSTLALVSTIGLPLDNTSEDTGANSRGLPNYLAGIAINPANTKAVTVAKKDNIVRGKNRDGNTLTFETTVRNAISTLNLSTNKENLAERIDIDNHAQPSAVAFSPLGTHLFVAMQGNNRVIILDPANGNEIARIDVGLAPEGLAIDPITNKVFVNNFMDRTVSVLDATSMITDGSSEITTLATVKTVASEKLTPQVLLGKKLFYNAEDPRMGMDGYLACATCHNNDEHDGRTWDFTDRGEGFRSTISLKGRAGMGQGLVHWTGNFDEIQDFENDMRNHIAGKGFMSDADFNSGKRNKVLGGKKAGFSTELDALSAYINTLDKFDQSPNKASDGTLTADAIAGKTLFNQLKCNSCHSGAGYTNSEKGLLHDVGTLKSTSGKRLSEALKGLDTPTLLDVWNTAPYLHDGSAKTLNDVLTTQNNGGHGSTAGLSAVQVNQLVSYLQQLDGNETASGTSIELGLSSPLNGSVIEIQEAVPLTISTTITGINKVQYYDNDVLVAESSTSPFNATFTPLKWGEHILQAKVIYNNSKTSTISKETKITYKRQLKALLVVGNTMLNPGDKIIEDRFIDKGFEVTIIDDNIVKKTNAIGQDIILMSSTINPDAIGEELTHNISVPVLSWNPFSYQHLRLTGRSYETQFGYTPTAYTTASIPATASSHPMAAGLTGNVPLYYILQKLPFGAPSEGDAIVIAKAGERALIFGNDKMTGASPASHRMSRKVAFPLRADFLHLFSEDGWKLFDAAVNWAIYGGNTQLEPLTDIKIISPKNNATVLPSFQVSFKTDNWPLSAGGNQVQYFVDGQQAGLTTAETPIQFNNLSLGTHTISLELADKGYIRNGIKHSIQVTISNTATADPAINIVSPLNNSVANNPVSIGFSVENWTMAVGGKGLNYYIDGVLGGKVFNNNAIALPVLTSGLHEIKLQLVNADNTLNAVQKSVSFTIPAPAVPSINIISPLSGSNVANPVSVSFGVENWTMAVGGKGLNYYIDGVLGGKVFNNNAIALPVLTSGLHEIKLQLVNADNTLNTTQKSVSFTVPAPALPSLSIITPKNDTKVLNPVKISFSVGNWTMAVGGKGVSYYVDSVWKGKVFNTNDITLPALEFGKHEITLQLVNTDGTPTNIQQTVKFEVPFIQAPTPKVEITSPTNNSVVNNPVNLDFSVSNWDMTVGGKGLNYYVDGVLKGKVFNTNRIVLPTLSSGIHEIKLQLVNADNTLNNAQHTVSFTVPTVVVLDPILNIISPTNAAKVNNPVSISFSIQNWEMAIGGKGLNYYIDGILKGKIHKTSPIILSELSNGLHEIKLQLVNADNTLNVTQKTVSFTVEPIALPSISIVSPLNNATVSQPFNLSVNISNWAIAPAGKNYHYFIDGLDKGAIYNTNPLSISGLSSGAHILKVQLAEANQTLLTTAGTSASVSITVPPITIGNSTQSKVAIEYRPNTTSANTGSIEPLLRIVNDSSATFAYKDLKIRYWYTLEGNAGQEFWINYTPLGSNNVIGTFVPAGGNNYYLEVSFKDATGNLNANSNSGDINLRWNKIGWSSHDQTNDYSFAIFNSFTKTNKITLYHKGVRIWGNEPNTGARLGSIANNFESKNEIKLFPIPAKNGQFIQLEHNLEQDQTIDVIWYNSLGSLIKQQKINANKGKQLIQIETSNLKAGNYNVKIATKEKQFIKKVSIK